MKIAILGTGTVGTALATGLIVAGHEVTFGSRSSKSGLVAPATSPADAVSTADVVINAQPGGSSLASLQAIGANTLGSRILLDVANASTPELALVYPNDSLARNIQETFPDLRVVKSLNTFNTSVMTDPSALPTATTVFVSGNDAAAKSAVRELLVDLGWEQESHLDLGDISTARGPEHYFLLFFATLQALGTPVFNIGVVR